VKGGGDRKSELAKDRSRHKRGESEGWTKTCENRLDHVRGPSDHKEKHARSTVGQLAAEAGVTPLNGQV
jgi:hypothetical protein